LALVSAFSVCLAAPVFAQNTQSQPGQSSQDQMQPGAAPNDNTGTQKPQHRIKKHHGATSQPQQDSTTGQVHQDKAHPGNSNQVGTPMTEPGGKGTQSGKNPVTPDTGSSSSSGSTR